MGNTSVNDIRQAGLGVIKATLLPQPQTWALMDWTTVPGKNSIQFQDYTYGMMSLGGPASEANPLQSLCFDQKFAIYLCRNVPHQSGDQDVVTVADQLIGLMVDCMIQLVKQKFGAPTSAGVLNVGDPSYKEPSSKQVGEFLVLEGEITVTYMVKYS